MDIEKNSRIKTLALLTFVLVTSLFLLEVISTLIISGTRIQKIYSIISPDKKLIWRNKAHFIGDFFGAKTTLNQDGFRTSQKLQSCNEGTFRLGILGASPSFGWGVDYEKSYGSLLKNKLELRLGRKVCLINFSNIGYSSAQGLALLNKLKPKLDLAIVTFITNDVDHSRFYFNSNLTDIEVLQKKISSFRYLMAEFFYRSSFPKAVIYLSQKIFKKPPPKVINPRVNLNQFKQNIEETFLSLEKDGAKTLFFLPPNGLAQLFFFLRRQGCDLPQDIKSLSTKCTLQLKELVQAKQDIPQDFYQAIRVMSHYEKLAKSIKELIPEQKRELYFLEKHESFEPQLFLSEQKDFIHFSYYGHEQISELLYNKVLTILK